MGGDNHVGNSSIAIASSGTAAVDPLRDALGALDRRDYATAQRLFEALGERGAAPSQVKGSASAALAALAPPEPAASAGGSMMVSDSRAQQKPAPSPVEVIPFVDAAYRRPLPQAEKAKSRHLRPILLGVGLVIIATCGAYVVYGLPPNRSFAATKSQEHEYGARLDKLGERTTEIPPPDLPICDEAR
jgi:hypothetical protein